jgi:hypothetical protein
MFAQFPLFVFVGGVLAIKKKKVFVLKSGDLVIYRFKLLISSKRGYILSTLV